MGCVTKSFCPFHRVCVYKCIYDSHSQKEFQHSTDSEGHVFGKCYEECILKGMFWKDSREGDDNDQPPARGKEYGGNRYNTGKDKGSALSQGQMKGSECVLRLLGARDVFGGTKPELCCTKVAFVLCMCISETSGRNERNPRKLWHQPVLLVLDTPLAVKQPQENQDTTEARGACASQVFLQISRCWEEWLIYEFILGNAYKVGCGKKVKGLGYACGVRKSDYEVCCKKGGDSREAVPGQMRLSCTGVWGLCEDKHHRESRGNPMVKSHDSDSRWYLMHPE